MADTMQLCPYCGYVKEPTDFTDEHVLPRALGGAVRPTNPFVCRVCRSCNAAVGRWIDGWFTRSPLIYNFRTRATLAKYDPESEPTFPLFFFGSLQDWSQQGGINCDFWLGPTGDQIFHFHRPYESRSAIFAGVPPHMRSSDVDPGNVFVRVVATNPEWHPIIQRSVRAAFEPGTNIHWLNAAPPGHTAPYPSPAGVAVQQYEWIRARPKQNQISGQIAMEMDLGTRFLIKCGLGFGTCFFGPEFPSSDCAKLLRQAMWERDPEARERLGVRGFGFFSETAESVTLPEWKSCHIIALVKQADQVGLHIALFGRDHAAIQLGGHADPWFDRVPYEGLLWIVAHGFGRFAGPMSYADYVIAATGGDLGPLSPLDEAMARGAPLPPFHRTNVAS